MMSTNHNKKQRRLAAEEADVNDDKYDQDGPDEDMLGVSTSKRQRNRQRTDGGNNDNKKGIVAASRIDNGSKANNNLPATATRTANPSGLTPQQQRQQHAKDRLSKFAARLFDASRPKASTFKKIKTKKLLSMCEHIWIGCMRLNSIRNDSIPIQSGLFL
jgi:hypothetical protein